MCTRFVCRELKVLENFTESNNKSIRFDQMDRFYLANHAIRATLSGWHLARRQIYITLTALLDPKKINCQILGFYNFSTVNPT